MDGRNVRGLFGLLCYFLVVSVGEKYVFLLFGGLVLQFRPIWRDSLHTNLLLTCHVGLLLDFILFLHKLDMVAFLVKRTSRCMRPLLAYIVIIRGLGSFLTLVLGTSR